MALCVIQLHSLSKSNSLSELMRIAFQLNFTLKNHVIVNIRFALN